MREQTTIQIAGGNRYVTSRSSETFIHTQQDFLDLLAVGIENGTSLLVLRDSNLDPAFYDLKTGLAGEILQKVADYAVRLAIVGPIEGLGSKRFQELARECNSGTSVRFAPSKNDALAWLMAPSSEVATIGKSGGKGDPPGR